MIQLLQKLDSQGSLGDEQAPASIGVVTPYKGQKFAIKRLLHHANLSFPSTAVEVNTVDGFQGREKDVIIVSTVRCSGGGLGFVADIRRMNVAITRAKHGLYILGHPNTLSRSKDWKALLDDAKIRGKYLPIETTSDLWKEPLPAAEPGTSSPRRSPRKRPLAVENAASLKPVESMSQATQKAAAKSKVVAREVGGNKAVTQRHKIQAAAGGVEKSRGTGASSTVRDPSGGTSGARGAKAGLNHPRKPSIVEMKGFLEEPTRGTKLMRGAEPARRAPGTTNPGTAVRGGKGGAVRGSAMAGSTRPSSHSAGGVTGAKRSRAFDLMDSPPKRKMQQLQDDPGGAFPRKGRMAARR